MPPSPNHLALLRGINVGGRNRVPMRDLKVVCERLGWTSVGTCLQSGNIVFASSQPTDSLESSLEAAINAHFKLSIPVVSRSLVAFERILKASPLRSEARDHPSHVILYLSKNSVKGTAQQDLQCKAESGERVIRAGHEALWIDFPNGIARSKLTPKAIDAAVGSPATGRNWKTACRIMDLASSEYPQP